MNDQAGGALTPREKRARLLEDELVTRFALSEPLLARVTEIAVELVVRARGWGAEDPARVARRVLERLVDEVLDP